MILRSIGAAATLIAASLVARPVLAQHEPTSLRLTPCRVPGVTVRVLCGTDSVYENRTLRRGRRIPLFVRVIPSSAEHAAPDPLVFVSAGGPGTTNSEAVGYAMLRGWSRDRDVVMVDLRGTSEGSRLDCASPGSPEHPAGYLASPFDTLVVRECRDRLAKRFDLRQYTTNNVVDDLHDALLALGYGRVDLWAASGGTREVLEYVRRHPADARAAIIEGTAPVGFKNPLPHAAAAQEALDSLFAQCARDEACHAAYPKLADDFSSLEQALKLKPVRAAVPSDLGGRDSAVTITWPMVAEIVRTMSYTPSSERTIPYVVHHAAMGDFGPLIVAGVSASRRTRDAIRFGFLLSQTCTEDVPRITESEIRTATRGTYLGDTRVRAQQAVCRLWPHGDVAAADFEPVRSEVPVFLLSGTIDPVTRPRFAQEAARYLPHSIHVIAPGGHVPGGPCVDSMERAFLASALPSAVDTSCVARMTLPAFRAR